MQIILNELPQTAAEFSAADLTRPEMTCALFLAALQHARRERRRRGHERPARAPAHDRL